MLVDGAYRIAAHPKIEAPLCFLRLPCSLLQSYGSHRVVAEGFWLGFWLRNKSENKKNQIDIYENHVFDYSFFEFSGFSVTQKPINQNKNSKTYVAKSVEF